MQCVILQSSSIMAPSSSVSSRIFWNLQLPISEDVAKTVFTWIKSQSLKYPLSAETSPQSVKVDPLISALLTYAQPVKEQPKIVSTSILPMIFLNVQLSRLATSKRIKSSLISCESCSAYSTKEQPTSFAFPCAAITHGVRKD